MTRWSFDPEPPPDDALVTIRVFEKQSEYAFAKSLLESAGIECFARDEHTARIAGPYHALLGGNGTVLQVRKNDAEDALAILNAPPLDENYGIEE